MPVCHTTKHLLPLLLSLMSPTHAASNAVVNCRDESGGQHFSQFHCPPGTHPIEMHDQASGNLTIIATAPLSDAEKRALSDLEKSLEADRKARARHRQKTARRRTAQAEADRSRCNDAVRHLEDLANTRRKGYSASVENRLEAEEARWRATKRAAC